MIKTAKNGAAARSFLVVASICCLFKVDTTLVSIFR